MPRSQQASSPWLVLLLVPGQALAYVLAFPWLFSHFTDTTRVFSLGIICAGAWFWGLRGGMITALATFALNAGLHWCFHFPFRDPLVGIFIGLLVGFVLGRLRGTHKRLLQQMELQRETALQVQALNDKLEQEIERRTAELRQEINERRRAQTFLEDSEEAYRTLVDNLPSGIFMVRGDDGRFIHLNRHILDMFGYTKEESANFSLWDVTAPEDHEIIRRRMAQRQQGKRPPTESKVYTCLHKDGTPILCEIWVSLAKYQGQPILQGLLHDVGPREKRERQMRHAQKMEAVGKLSSGVAHDFNNILQAMTGYLELLAQRLAHDQIGRRYVQSCERTLNRATDLVRRLLTFSRETELNFQPLDLNREVTSVAAMLEHTIPKMVLIQTRLEASRPMVIGDGSQITQLIMNLATNAVDAMPDGGTLTLATRNQLLDEEFCRQNLEAKPGEYLVLEVRDTGTGIDPSISKDIFDPFFTTKEVGKGTGLGLSIVYGVVKSHRGVIQMESQPGQGTTFRVLIPALDVLPEMVPDSLPVAGVLLTGRETLLLVDDEEPILEVGRQLLGDCGYRVVTASSGEEALAIFDEMLGRIDLVLLDLSMPGMGGMKTLEALKDRQTHVKVLVCSGYATHTQAAQVIEAGAAGFLAKPFPAHALLAKLRQILDQPT